MAQRFFTIILLFFCSTFFTLLNVQASFFDINNRNQFISANRAFVFDFKQQGSQLHLSWQIYPGYYLYRQQIKIVPQQAELGRFVIPDGLLHKDEFYGDVTVFNKQLDLQIPLENVAGNASVKVVYQGCAEAGFCYPPETRIVPLSMIAKDNTTSNIPTSPTIEKITFSPTSLPFSPLLALLIGIGIAFTPCVLPMYPLISGIILGGEKPHGYKQILLLAMVYVQGMALTYTVLGVTIAAAGLQFQAMLQHPYVLVGISIVFICLAMSMFGLYSLQFPALLQTRLVKWSNHQRTGSLSGVFVMGMLAGLICSPCTTAPLSAILLYIAQSGNILTGGGVLYLYAFGMGMPLIVVTVFGNRFLPRSGRWMQYVKEAFGFVILALPVFLLERIVGDVWALILWSMLGVAFLGWAFVLSLNVQRGYVRILSIFLLAAVLITARPLQDWAWNANTQQTLKNHLNFQRVDNLAQINIALTEGKGKYIMLDLYADWCVTCKEFEKYTFSDMRVRAKFRDIVVLQADVTVNSTAQTDILKQFKVLGLPTILFFDPEGNEILHARVSGFMDAQQFLSHLHEILS